VPEMVEFWQGRRSRLHDRLAYQRQFGGWHVDRLAP
jgi:pyridoxamine 5'-phosphate oxidase